MNLIDLIILLIALGILGLIIYSEFVKQDKDICAKCAYKRTNCNFTNNKKTF